jgi:hypothetical protein
MSKTHVPLDQIEDNPYQSRIDTANETLSAKEYRRKYGEESQPELDGLAPPPDTCEQALAIDPGKTSGLAWTDGERIVTAKSDFWETWNALASMAPGVALSQPTAGLTDASALCVILEAPYKSRQSMGAGPAVAYNSGGVAREAELMAEWLRETEYTLLEHDPSQQGSKWDAAAAEQIVGDWEGPNNEHVRDAVRLLFFYDFL